MAEIEGFDPKTDPAQGITKAEVKDGYKRLVNRGEEDAAEEVRKAESVHEQREMLKNYPEFDPEHDEPYNLSRVRIVETYEALCELADRDEAEEDETAEAAREAAENLRELDSVREQADRATELQERFGLDLE